MLAAQGGLQVAERDSEKFDIARVISRSFEVIGGNPGLYLGLAALLAGVPNFAINFWLTGSTTGLDGSFNDATVVFQRSGLTLLVTLIAAGLLQAAVTRGTVATLAGERIGFGACLRAALRLAVPVCGIVLLTWLALLLTGLTVLIPGYFVLVNTALPYEGGILFAVTAALVTLAPICFVYVLLSAAVPAYVAERQGLFESFGRSIELTSGMRWKMFLLVLIGTIAMLVLAIPAGLMNRLMSASEGPVLPVLTGAVTTAASGMFSAVLLASAYVELREVKDGVAPGDLESIFA